MAEVEYEREVGSGNQLPQGSAAQVNEMANALMDEKANATGLVDGVEYSDTEEPDFVPSDERDEILFGDSQGLGRDMPDRPDLSQPVPASVVRRLPALARAANKPDAPASLRAMYFTLLRKLESEMSSGR